jgi:hypothetical protein
MSKLGTFLHIVEGIGRVADPRIAQAIDAGKAIAHAKGADRVSAVMTEIDTSLDLAGDLSGKAAVSDPALRALVKKYVEDGIALHAYIESHKAQQAQPGAAPSAAAE